MWMNVLRWSDFFKEDVALGGDFYFISFDLFGVLRLEFLVVF